MIMKLLRPLARWRVTGDTASHAAYGVGPATDYAWPDDRALPIGTPVRAPFAASGIIPWGTRQDIGGLALRMFSKDGRFLFVAQHLSGYAKDRPVNAGDVIAYSGNTGTLTSGPHLHCYIVASGIRMSMEDAIRKYGLASSTAGSDAESFPTEDEETIMLRGRSANTGHWYVFGPLGVIIIRSGAKGSENYKRAVAYNTALGGESFPELSSAELTFLIKDWEAMRVDFFEAMGNTAAVKKIRADVAQVLELEKSAPRALGVEQLREELRVALSAVALEGANDGVPRDQLADLFDDIANGLRAG